MIEVSAATSPVLALKGAVLPAAPSASDSEGTQIVDFSAVLSGAALAAAKPALTEIVADAPTAPPAPVAVALPVQTGKTGTGGNQTGKLLPPGKSPAARKPAAELNRVAERAGDDAAEPELAAAPRSSEEHTATANPAEEAVSLAQAPSTTVAPTTTQALLSQERRTNTALPREARRVSSPSKTSAVVAASKLSTALAVAPANPGAAPDGEAMVPATASTLQAAPQVTATNPVALITRNAGSAPDPSSAQPAALAAAMVVAAQDAVTMRDGSHLPPTLTIVPAAAPDMAVASTTLVATANPVAAQLPTARQMRAAFKPSGPQVGNDTNAFVAASMPATLVSASGDSASLPSAAAAIATPSEHKATHPIATAPADVLAPTIRTELPAVHAELRPPPAAPTPPASQPSAPQTLDLAALVDRITEARAAAAPHTVRAALVHEDFGSVSLNFRPEDTHIHVTLGSDDPGFAPAVHAAAAATLTASDADRRETGHPPAQHPQNAHSQSTASDAAMTNNAASQQHSPRERSAGGERLARENTQGRQKAGPNHTPSDPASSRRGGIYA